MGDYIDSINGGDGKKYSFLPTENYPGEDLSTVFADEIKSYTDAWAWIRARIKAGNYDGIHVNDYIAFKTTNNVNLNARVAGIDP